MWKSGKHGHGVSITPTKPEMPSSGLRYSTRRTDGITHDKCEVRLTLYGMQPTTPEATPASKKHGRSVGRSVGSSRSLDGPWPPTIEQLEHKKYTRER